MKLNHDQIINEYKSKNFTLVDLANKHEVDYRRIRTILVKNNIEIINGNKIKPVSEERKLKMSKIKKEMFASGKLKIWCKGKKRNKIDLYKNMKAHLKYEIELEWLMKYEDIEKLKFLNKSLTRERNRIGFNTEIYKKFIEKFYFDNQFNILYAKWLLNKTDVWLKPSLDHIKPKSKGGSLTDLNNLQFLTWLENKCKSNIEQINWTQIKLNINKYFV
jgi:hypothetical protein